MYQKIFITNLPAFYKINLYNLINEKINIFVIYTGDTADIRNKDFFSGNMNFDYVYLEEKSSVKKAIKVKHLLKKYPCNELIIGGWDSLSMWISAFYSPKRKNSVVIESSYYESKINGIKGLIKKIFMRRISKVYASGKAQEKLAKLLNFKGDVIKTKGVGVFNFITQPAYEQKNEVKNFIYVGRLSPEKNLEYLITVFNDLPQYTLNIVGFGPLESKLKTIAQQNIIFYGAVENKLLSKYYKMNDVFILPSLSETWGLVTEEALNNGLPVIVSNKVGCAEEIINSNNGIIFKLEEFDSLKNAIYKITNIEYYNNLRYNISNLDFEKIEAEQVNCYL